MRKFLSIILNLLTSFTALSQNDVENVKLLANAIEQRILSGYTNSILLVDTVGIRIENEFPEVYKRLVIMQDSLFMKELERFQEKGLTINVELAFQIRNMFREDEKSKFRIIVAEKQNLPAEEFKRKALETDSLNEVELTKIIEKHGFPGFNLVGNSSSDAYTIFLHMSKEFQRKYVCEVQKAIADKKLNISQDGFYFLVDKILYKWEKPTLYGTSWSKYFPVETDPERRKELLIFLGLNE